MGRQYHGLHFTVLALRAMSHSRACLLFGHWMRRSPGPSRGQGVAVCPQPPSVHGAELGSPNRGHYSTKQIFLLLTLGNSPSEVKGALCDL